MRNFIAIALCLFSIQAHGALSTLDRSLYTQNTLLKNGGFESGKAGWTASGGTFTITTTAANVSAGTQAGAWDSNGAAQTLTSAATTVPAGGGPANRNGVVSCSIQTPSGTATHTLQAFDGTNILASTTIFSSTRFIRTSINFIYPNSGTIALRLVSVNANEPAINIDDCYTGLAEGFNLSTASQATMYGSLTYPGTASCDWTRTSNATFGGFAAVAACTTPAGSNLSGAATAPATKIPAVTFSNMPPGDYLFIASGSFVNNTAGSECSWRFHDGTSGSAAQSSGSTGTATNTFITTVSGRFAYTTSATRTIELQTTGTVGNQNCGIGASAVTTRDLTITAYQFPTQQEISFRPESINWMVDANISGANPSLGTAAQTAYTGITDAGLTLTNNSALGGITAQIPCDTTNPPTGTTCAVGNESIGVSFVLPIAAQVRACASLTVQTNGGASDPDVTLQLVETPNNAQTITQEGKSRLETKQDAAAGNLNLTPFTLCGTFNFTSAGQKTLRVFYEQLASTNAATILADAAANNGQRDIHWEVYPVNRSQSAPVLVGSVTSNSTGAERIERATIASGGACNTSPCTINSQSGSWLSSVTRASAGVYTAVINSGIFTTTPTCIPTVNINQNARAITDVAASSTTAAVVRTGDAAGAAVDSGFNLICIGTR